MKTIYSCGIKINPISVNEISTLIDIWSKDDAKGIQITGVNKAQIALLYQDKEFASYINASDIVNIDGVVVSWYLRLKGYKSCNRTLCADILTMMLQKANERSQSIYLLGATQEILEQLVSNIQQQYPNINIIGFHNGYFKDEREIVDDIKLRHPDYLFIGMPSPFKERFITTYKKELGARICFGVGGMFDILAGKTKRAPERIQKMGLEWLYRIYQNPVGHTKRVFKTSLPCIAVFLKYLFESKKESI